MAPSRVRLAFFAIVVLWLALRVIYWNGYYTEDSPGYVSDAIWLATGNYHVRDHVNGLNVATYFPVALPLWLAGKSEVALSIWPLTCSLLGLCSIAAVSRAYFGDRAALLAAFLYATYPGDVFFSTVVMPDAVQSGWFTLSLALIALAPGAARPWRLLAAAGGAIGVCHLARANDVLLLPAGILAAGIAIGLGQRRGWTVAARAAAIYAAGWAAVLTAEGLIYAATAGDFFWRLHVVQRHYGTADSILRAGLNVDPHTIPYSLFAPVSWWARGEWGWQPLNQDQAYHGLLFCWAILALTIGAAIVVWRGRGITSRMRAGSGVAAAWLLWPILYHQFGSQSLSHYVPMHRLSRHLVVYAPAAMFAIAGGAAMTVTTLRDAGLRTLNAGVAFAAAGALLLHLVTNVQGERTAYHAFHQIKDTYARIRERLPQSTRTLVADPGDLCFFDFWLNPLGSERVRMVAFAAVPTCDEMSSGVVLTQSNPGWSGGAPVILDTVRRLPCLVTPPPTWRLLYTGYAERVFVIDGEDRHARR